MVEVSPLVVRRPRFGLTATTNVEWAPQRPELACAANSVSLLMPYMEPYFVRSVAAAVPQLSGELGATARAYLAQESEHQHQHRLYNQALLARHPRLALVERVAERFYRWLDRRAGPRFNLAFVAASETIAYSAARWAADRRQPLFDGVDETVAELFWWHLAEEVEHKAVAHDVWRVAGGRWWLHLGAMVVALATVIGFVIAGTTIMLGGQRRLHRPLAWGRLAWWAVTFAFELLPNLALSLLPRFHPDQFADPAWYDVWHREHDGPRRPSTAVEPGPNRASPPASIR
jgi:predicted metal-dependent hydrolase